MFKKTLVAAAALGAFAGAAVAADVELYGIVDYGFSYQYVDSDAPGADSGSSFAMKSGQNSGSRFGFRGSEDLGNGLKVGFVLENGFNADDGTLDNNGRLFGRESQVYLQGDFGTISFGRVGKFVSTLGSFALMGKTSPFGAGWGDSAGQKFLTGSDWGRTDNTITYKSPTFSGVNVLAQYSFQSDTTKDYGDEGKSTADRYYAIAATYQGESLYLVGVVDTVNYSSEYYDTSWLDDQIDFTLGGSYDFGFMTFYVMGQYFMNSTSVGVKSAFSSGALSSVGSAYSFGADVEGADGYGIALSVGVPCFGGTAKAQLGYLEAEANKSGTYGKPEVSRWNITAGYDYNLSKRTTFYSAVSYTRDSADNFLEEDTDPQSIEVMAGLVHRF